MPLFCPNEHSVFSEYLELARDETLWVFLQRKFHYPPEVKHECVTHWGGILRQCRLHVESTLE